MQLHSTEKAKSLNQQPSSAFLNDEASASGAVTVGAETGVTRTRAVLWLVLLLLGAVVANLAGKRLLAYLESTGSTDIQAALTGMLVLTLVLYAILLAIPFVPGVEIGLFLLMTLGAPVAPYVYFATVIGLAAGFLLGRYMPTSLLCRLMGGVGLRRACAFLEYIEPLGQKERIALIQGRMPDWLGPRLVKYRYLVVAVALNVPGNALIGGGGGIALTAGLSRIFSPAATLLTIAVAVSPVALAVYVFGAGILN
uniref:hypothetical protein n=1 Tax=Yoonia sp. TaxID=2212373 RepID=UPI004047CFA4